MIHTFAVIQSISETQLQQIVNCFGVPSDILSRFTSHNLRTRIPSIRVGRHILNNHNPDTGIRSMILWHILTNAGWQYYAVIIVEPLVMINGERSMRLFRADPLNVFELETHFHHIMSRFFDDESLCTLSCWSCHRIDYTVNLKFKTEQEKSVFLELTKKTSFYIRRHRKRIIGIDRNAQSTAENNKSIKIMFYDKQQQIRNVYRHIPDTLFNQLYIDAEGIIRFEVQCKKGRIRLLADQYHFENSSIIHYLNEDIALSTLLKEYEKSVGSGDFFTLYHAKKRIDSSQYSPSQKQYLYQLLQLNAQARHIDIAKEQFIAGTLIKRTDIVVHGSLSTFRKRIKLLKSLGINPMPIPKEHRITYLRNPKYQVELNNN